MIDNSFQSTHYSRLRISANSNTSFSDISRHENTKCIALSKLKLSAGVVGNRSYVLAVNLYGGKLISFNGGGFKVSLLLRISN